MASNYYTKPVEQGQDIYDLCLQEYGDIQAIWLLLEDNPSLDLIRALVAGEPVVFRVELPDQVPVDKNVMDYFRVQNIRVNMQEMALLEDGAYNTTVGGAIDSVLPDLTPAGAGGSSPTIMTGIQTSSGVVIRTRAGDLLLSRQPPVLQTASDQVLLTASGTSLLSRPPVFNYLQTTTGAYIKSANDRYILLH